MLVVGNDGQFARTCAVLGRAGTRHQSEIRQEQRPRRERQGDHGDFRRSVPEAAGGIGWTNWRRPACPSGPINDFAQVFADPHVRERGMEIKVDHPFEPSLSLIRNPITFSGTPVTDYRAPPLLGENTREVLTSQLGYDDAKIDR